MLDICSSNTGDCLYVFCVGNSDYISITANLQQLTPEDSSAIISIDIVNDNITEGEEYFAIVLSSASPESIVSPSTAVITILDDDSQGISVISPRACPCRYCEVPSTTTHLYGGDSPFCISFKLVIIYVYLLPLIEEGGITPGLYAVA